jgi:protein O-GlcNAcase/histone acetyltransferase
VNPNNEFAINFIPLHTLSAFLQGEGAWQPREAFLAAATEWLAKYETDRLPIADEDLVLLADCYYLPHDEGPEAQTLYRVIDRLLRQPVDSWGDAYEKFSAMNRRIQSLFERLTELHDRELFHAWSRRAWEFKEEMQMIDSLLTQKKAGRDLTAGIALETHLPGTYRGGMVAKLERLFSMDDRGTIRPRAST